MPGQQLKSTWIGNRAELLAVYALSSIAAVTQVRRENDFGFDLLCTLLSHQEKVLRAGHSFGLQVKSVGEIQIRYGGLNRRNEWKGYEIDWLFNQDQPILIALADTRNWNVKLYSIARIWYILYQIGPNPGEVVLIPDEELPSSNLMTKSHQWRYIDESLPVCADGKPAGNGFSYQVPLGKPIVELSLDNDDNSHLAEIRDALDEWLVQEYFNIMQRNLGIPTYLEWQAWQPNQVPGPAKIIYAFWNDAPGANILKLLTTVSPTIVSILLHLRHQNDFDQARAVLPMARWLQDKDLLGKLGSDALSDIESNLKGSQRQ